VWYKSRYLKKVVWSQFAGAGLLPKVSRANFLVPEVAEEEEEEKETDASAPKVLVRIHFIIVMIRWTGRGGG